MNNKPEIITINDRYNNILDEGAKALVAGEAQLNFAAWGVMKVIHDTCEKAFVILNRFGVSGPGQWRRQKEMGLNSMHQTYKDLALKARKSPASIKNAHIWFKHTKEIMGDEDKVLLLELPPSVAGIITESTKISNEEKATLLKKAIKKALTGSQVRREIRVLSGEEELDPIFRTNLWSARIPEAKFGMIYPGRIPGQIVYNILHHYTEVGDLCLFPFVGGGTEADVAHYMGREYYAWDIHHVDAVAQRHGERYFTANSLAPWQVTKVLEEKADLVFADVPRFMWGNGKWEDSDNEDNYDISKQDLEEFMESMELVARNAFMSLKNGGKFAILLRQPGFVDIPSEDLTFTLMSEKFNRFELVSRLHVTFPTTAHRPTEKGRFANECMDLLIMEKH